MGSRFKSSYFLSGSVLALTVFPVLTALAFKYTHGHLFESGLAARLTNQCAPPTSAVRGPYTGVVGIDDTLCGLVAFFHSLMSTATPFKFLSYFLGIGAHVVAIPAVEAARQGRSIFIAFPVIFGLCGQILDVGVTMPIYWLIFILTGMAHPSRPTKGAAVTQAHAEAIVFGILLGAVIPSICMLNMQDPQMTAIWQAYPIYVSIAQFGHLLFRPPSQHSESGYRTIQALYIGIFVISSSIHIAMVWPIVSDTQALKDFLLPSTTVLGPSTPIELQALDFLKWDYTFAFLSSIIATFWFSKSLKQLLVLVAWNLVATPIVGPSAAVIGAALWRESVLEGEINMAPRQTASKGSK